MAIYNNWSPRRGVEGVAVFSPRGAIGPKLSHHVRKLSHHVGLKMVSGPRPVITPTISDSTIKKFLEVRSKEQVIEMLRRGGYPIPPFLLSRETSTDAPDLDNRPADQGETTDCRSKGQDPKP